MANQHDEKGKRNPIPLGNLIISWNKTKGAEYSRSFRCKANKVVTFLTSEIKKRSDIEYEKMPTEQRDSVLAEILNEIKFNTNRKKKKKIHVKTVYEYVRTNKL